MSLHGVMKEQMQALGYYVCDADGNCADNGAIVGPSYDPTQDGYSSGVLMTGTPLTTAQLAQLGVQIPVTTGTATNANSTSGLTALSQLTAAAASRLTALPGQTSLQAGQTLTMGPGGTYQITAAGTPAGATLGTSLSGLSLPLLLMLGAGAVLLMRGK